MASSGRDSGSRGTCKGRVSMRRRGGRREAARATAGSKGGGSRGDILRVIHDEGRVVILFGKRLPGNEKVVCLQFRFP
jgi:hypothetical protein